MRFMDIRVLACNPVPNAWPGSMMMGIISGRYWRLLVPRRLQKEEPAQFLRLVEFFITLGPVLIFHREPVHFDGG